MLSAAASKKVNFHDCRLFACLASIFVVLHNYSTDEFLKNQFHLSRFLKQSLNEDDDDVLFLNFFNFSNAREFRQLPSSRFSTSTTTQLTVVICMWNENLMFEEDMMARRFTYAFGFINSFFFLIPSEEEIKTCFFIIWSEHVPESKWVEVKNIRNVSKASGRKSNKFTPFISLTFNTSFRCRFWT